MQCCWDQESRVPPEEDSHAHSKVWDVAEERCSQSTLTILLLSLVGDGSVDPKAKSFESFATAMQKSFTETDGRHVFEEI